MLKPNEIEAVSMAFDKPMRELENRIMADIVRRIKINGEITRAADWQINRLYQLGMAKADIKKSIAESLNLSDKEMLEMYKKIVKSGYERDRNTYLKAGGNIVPFEENAGLQQLLNAISEQTYGTLKNITNSLGFSTRNEAGKLEFKPIADYYQQTLDGAMLDIASGAFDYNTVLQRVVNEMTNSGLRTVDYATGWANRVDVAARRAVMTGMSQLTAKVNEDNAKALDTEYFEVSYHGGARPSHQEWQGKVYTKEQLVSICGLGEVDGLCGANCYHDYYPFIPGISERTYTDRELAKMNREENTPREFGGKQYTKYEALQRQRRLETTMRAQKQKINLLEAGGADEKTLLTAKVRYRTMSYEYTRFSKAMGLPEQRERVRVSGDFVPKVGAKRNGSVSAGERLELLKSSLTSKTESGIIKEEKFYPLLDDSFNHSKSMDQLKAAWEPFVSQNVTDAEWQGINGGYVRTPNSFRINEKLRNNPGAKIEELFKDPFDLRIVRDLDSAIDKNTLDRNVLLTRNVGLDYLTSTLELSPNDILNIYNQIGNTNSYESILKILNDKFVNEKVIERSFLSTSGNSSLNVFSNKPVRLEIKAPKGTKALVTKNFMESEVILGRGTKYTIESVERFAIDKNNFGLKFIVKVV